MPVVDPVTEMSCLIFLARGSCSRLDRLGFFCLCFRRSPLCRSPPVRARVQCACAFTWSVFRSRMVGCRVRDDLIGDLFPKERGFIVHVRQEEGEGFMLRFSLVPPRLPQPVMSPR